MSRRLAALGRIGRAKRIDGGADRYIEFAKRTLPRDMSFDGLRIVVDCANGAAYKAAPMALWELGAEVIAIGVEPDGLNINRDVGSTAPEALAAEVRERRADLGIALDGDADRVVLVDEKGRIIDGDQVMARGRRLLERREPARRRRRRRDRHVESRARALSRRARPRRSPRTPVGDRYVVEQMRQRGFNVGGEQSGHIILRTSPRPATASSPRLQVLAVIRRDGRPASEVCHRFEPVPQVMKNFRFNGGQPLENDQVQARDRRGGGQAERQRPARHPPVRHRAGDPRDGRGRQCRPRLSAGRRHRRGARQGRRPKSARSLRGR